MGLDMYLFRKEQDNSSDDDMVEVGYWRKANAVHNWFVKIVQGGTDDCGTYPVDIKLLVTLRNICREVLAHRHMAQILLPTQSGFFFGSTDYGESYFYDVERTVEILTSVIESSSPDEVYYYHASW